MKRPLSICSILFCALLWSVARAEEPKPEAEPSYTQQQNVVFADTDDGVGLIMDIFTPKSNPNGLAIVDIVSGGWSSARGRLEDHKKAQIFEIMCARGYTIFAIRPGSSSKFSAMEMVDNLEHGIRWVKSRASDYGIDPERMALCGASAGGHLTLLTLVNADDGDPKSSDPVKRQNTRIKAAVAFFPPTDFLDWGGVKSKPGALGPLAGMLGNLLYPGGIKKQTPEEVLIQAEKISPARQVTGNEPPVLFIHGDADLLVPLQQSKVMIEAFEKKGVVTELIVKKGGGHPWPTIYEEVAIAADWIDRQLRPEHAAAK